MPCSSSIVFFQSPPLLIIIIENSSNYLHVSAVNQNPTIFSSFVHPLRPLSSFRAASASACPLSFSQFALGSANLVRGGAERASERRRDAICALSTSHLFLPRAGGGRGGGALGGEADDDGFP